MMPAGAHDDADEPPPPPPRRPSLLKKSAPAQPWSDQETLHLIDAYDERWTALGRGQLKAQQWEEVAADTAARCAQAGVAVQRKTGTQCRHKLEKLRKRYRTEAARPVTSLWTFFRRMDQLERGPNAAASSAYPPAAGSPPAVASDEEDEEEEEEEEEENQEEEEEEEVVPRNNNTRSINGIIREFGSGLAPRHPQLQLQQPTPPPPPSSITPSTAPPRKRVSYGAFQAKAAAAAAAAVAADKVKEEDEVVELVRRSSGSGPGGGNAQLSAVLRDFSEGIMRLERRRMEMQWEIERGWQEVEARHTKMLQDAQRKLRDTIAAACTLPPKKARRDYGSSGDS